MPFSTVSRKQARAHSERPLALKFVEESDHGLDDASGGKRLSGGNYLDASF
jgi:hypothetical protein